MPERTTSSHESRRDDLVTLTIVLLLGLFALGIALAYHNIADGDLWARMVIGASAFHTHAVPAQDFLAFTPVKNAWIDHEWGAGLLFYTVVYAWGPRALLLLKMLTAFAVILISFFSSVRRCESWIPPILLAIPCALAILPGYIPVIRSHALTYLFFAILLVALESMRKGRRWPLVSIPVLMMVWTNVHGGFIAGLGILAVYTAHAMLRGRYSRQFLTVSAASLAVTFVNPYGAGYWAYVIPAIMHPRPTIVEWQPLSLVGLDLFTGFRICCVLAGILVLAGWRRMTDKRDSLVLGILLLTAILGWRHRRHAPFFGIAALMFLGPYARVVFQPVARRLSGPVLRLITAVIFAGITGWMSWRFLPATEFGVAAPRGFYPVREIDILQRSGLAGNVAVPFRWGSYAAWRLYPNMRVSMDGRYEVAFPESVFETNQDFYRKTGEDWSRLITDYPTDFIILEKRLTSLAPSDLQAHGFVPVWDDVTSALYARAAIAGRLAPVLKQLPESSPDPLSRSWTREWKSKIMQARQERPW